MPVITYIDRQDRHHELTVVAKVPAVPGFYEVRSHVAGRLFLNRLDILVDGHPATLATEWTPDREHLLLQPEDQS